MASDSMRDRPVRVIDEIAYEIRLWDTDRRVSAEKLAENIFDLATGRVPMIVSGQDPDAR